MKSQKQIEEPRRLPSLFITVCLILAIFTVMTITFTTINVRAEIWDDGANRTIENETRWRENVVIEVRDGDLLIKDNGTLILGNNVTLEIECSYAGEYGIKIETGGKFIINSTNADTEIVSDTFNPERTYSFTNSGTIDFLGATVERVYGDPDNKDTTGGIRNEPGSVCNLTNCNILDADTHSIYVKGNSTDSVELNIANTELTNTTSGVLNGTGIWVNGNIKAVIKNCLISNNSKTGIYCFDTNNNEILNNTISNNKLHGIDLRNCDNNTISNNTVYKQNNQSDSTGILINGSYNTVEFNNVTFSRRVGIKTVKNSHFNIIRFNTVAKTSYYGIQIGDDFGASNNNTVYNNTVNDTAFFV